MSWQDPQTGTDLQKAAMEFLTKLKLSPDDAKIVQVTYTLSSKPHTILTFGPQYFIAG